MAHRLAVKLDVFSTTPLYQQLASEVRRLVDEGFLGVGERLPSLRDLSKQLQISVITVRQSMDVLIADQYVVSRPGSGNYVADDHAQKKPIGRGSVEPVRFEIGSFRSPDYDLAPEYNWSEEATALTSAFNLFPFHPWWDVRLTHDFHAYQPSAEFLRGPRWEKSFGTASKALSQVSLLDTDPAGVRELRKQISAWLNRSRNLGCSPDDVVVVAGAQQGRELIARLFVRTGRTVVVEEPGSITDLLAYATKGGSLHHLQQGTDGIDISQLDEVIRPSVLHLITAANFPTGITLSEAKCAEVIDWARATGSLIVEDSYGAGFNYVAESPPAIFSMALETNVPVAYVGSLSQFTSPALRIGFIIARQPLRDLISKGKQMVDGHTSIVSQQMALTLFHDGFFDEHYLRLMKACRARRETLIEELSKWPDGLIEFTAVKCGFQQPIWFKEDIDDLYVFEQALKAQVGVIPMSPYFHASPPRHGLSLNFARNDEQTIREGLAKLLSVITQVRETNFHYNAS